MKTTNNIRLYKRYSVILKHFQGFNNKEIAEMEDRLELMFLPPYSPELNLIEGLWGWLKSDIINNKFYSRLSVVKDEIRKFIKKINKAPQITIDRICVRM